MVDLQISKMALPGDEVWSMAFLTLTSCSSIQQNWLSSSPQALFRQLKGEEFSVTGLHILQCLNSDEGACSKRVTTD